MRGGALWAGGAALVGIAVAIALGMPQKTGNAEAVVVADRAATSGSSLPAAGDASFADANVADSNAADAAPEPIVLKPLEGPFQSLDAYCRDYIAAHNQGWSAGPCSAGSGVCGPRDSMKPPPTGFRAARLVEYGQVGAVSLELAIETKRGTFVGGVYLGWSQCDDSQSRGQTGGYIDALPDSVSLLARTSDGGVPELVVRHAERSATHGTTRPNPSLA